MKLRPGSARRYADALFAIAVERGTMDEWAGELERIAGATREPEAMRVLAGPGLTIQRKQEIIDALAGPLSRETRSLVTILLGRKRTELLPALADAFAERVRERLRIARANVTTAVDLSEADRQFVAGWLTAYLSSAVEVETRVDPEIIGGVVARVGDRLIDASVRGRLELLKKRLAMSS